MLSTNLRNKIIHDMHNLKPKTQNDILLFLQNSGKIQVIRKGEVNNEL